MDESAKLQNVHTERICQTFTDKLFHFSFAQCPLVTTIRAGFMVTVSLKVSCGFPHLKLHATQ